MTTSPSLSVTTGTAAEDQGRLARDALRSQRHRLITLLERLGPEDWGAQSRCAAWSVHQVVRHLCDTTEKTTALLRGASLEDVDAVDMDPRLTPVDWLHHSTGQSPQETLNALEEATGRLLTEVDRCMAASADIEWIYGRVPWSTAGLHVFWDAWIHERDILLPLGRTHESPAVESRAAAAYGLLMAVLPALATGSSIRETVVLAGDGGGAFTVAADADPEGPPLSLAGLPTRGTVTVSSDGARSSEGDPPALEGELIPVVDSLVGREPDLDEALHGPADRVGSLGLLRAFMLTPAA